jgi:hypothetical protein
MKGTYLMENDRLYSIKGVILYDNITFEPYTF